MKRLTEYSHGAGCGCKLAPGELAKVVRSLTPSHHPDLLVGTETGDDAAVWRIDASRALVFTTDFFTPLVDDARTWGRISATNAISDVYAMGGTPIVALNIVAWNSEELSMELLGEVLDGASEVAADAGFVIAGGHTVDDPEPKFGLAVIGEVDPAKMLTNAGLRPGDALVLTKPVGIGVVSTAIKRGVADEATIAAAVASMTRTNAAAAEVALDMGATGATDVTGFGLLGHLGRMARESAVDVTVHVDTVPILPGVRELAEAGNIAGGSRRNLSWVDSQLDRGGRDDLDVTLMADAQTSGGLVFGVSSANAPDAVEQLRSAGHRAALIGSAVAGQGRIRLA